MQIRLLTNKDPEFYPLLGPFLARRNVEKEVGYKIYDDDDKEWFIALDDGRVIGFCYRHERSKGHYQVGSCYVVEEYRRKGVFRSLLRKALSDIKGRVSVVTKSPAMANLLRSEGFVELRARGSFIEYRKEIDHGVQESGV